MITEEEGWPLGLQPVNVRIGLERRVEGRDHFGSMSFNTRLTGSPTTTESSSDLDTESTGSFFHDRSITLGSLIGASSILDLSTRSVRAAAAQTKPAEPSKKTGNKSRTWMIFSLCSKEDSTDVTDYSSNRNGNPPSLGHFLAVERRAASSNHYHRRSHNHVYVPAEEISSAQYLDGSNSLFVDGRIAPPRVSTGSGGIEGRNALRFRSNLLSNIF